MHVIISFFFSSYISSSFHRISKRYFLGHFSNVISSLSLFIIINKTLNLIFLWWFNSIFKNIFFLIVYQNVIEILHHQHQLEMYLMSLRVTHYTWFIYLLQFIFSIWSCNKNYIILYLLSSFFILSYEHWNKFFKNKKLRRKAINSSVRKKKYFKENFFLELLRLNNVKFIIKNVIKSFHNK